MAARAGAAEVVSIEVVAELATVAEANAGANGFDGVLHVYNGHSTDVDALPSVKGTASVDVIVGELLDTGLIGEGAIASMRHAVSAFVKKGHTFIAIPSHATVHCELVQSEFLWAQHSVEAAVAAVGPWAWFHCLMTAI